MKDVEAMVTIVDRKAGQMFARRFSVSPIRIGRGPRDHLRLREARMGSGQAEIFFDPRGVVFRHRAWFRKSWVDGVRARRGQAMPLGTHSIVTIDRFEISVVVRRRETERARKVTPLALARPPGWEGRWNLDLVAEPYLAIETSATSGSDRRRRPEGVNPVHRERIDRPDLAARLASSRPRDSIADEIDEDLTKVAVTVFVDEPLAGRRPRR